MAALCSSTSWAKGAWARYSRPGIGGWGGSSPIKVMRKERLTGPDAIRRFHREIQAAAQLRHANVVLAYDAAQQGDTHFFAMEYIEGSDLSQLVRKNGPQSKSRC